MEIEAPLRLNLDGDALIGNWKSLAQISGPAATGAAVKADGYGLGATEVSKRLWNAGCRDFFVAHWAEAQALAQTIPAERIAVLNGISENDVSAAIELGAVPVLNTPVQIELWKAARGGQCHVMLDSGINRLGVGPEEMDASLFEGLEIDILMSHLACADEDVPQNFVQLRLFQELSRQIKAKRRSLANSAGILLGSDYHFDLTRPGLSLYGGVARPEMAEFIKPVASLSARILQVRALNAGQAVGYNGTFSCPTEMTIGTLSIGYADGYLRAFSGKGEAMYGNHKLPVIGRVSMDLVTVDLSDAPQLGEGDWIDIGYSLVTTSSTTGLSQYELLTNLGSRFERNWI